MANNLAKLSILAIVALSGYEMKLVLDPNDPLTTVIKSQNTTPKSNSITSNNSLAGSPQGGTSAHNIAHNKHNNSAHTINNASSPPTSSSASAYTSNATNIIQNSLHLVQSAAVAAAASEKSNFKSYVNIIDSKSESSSISSQTNGSIERQDSSVAVEKENTASNKKYAISGTAANVVVKQILDKLLTQFVSNKLAAESENEVNLNVHWQEFVN